MSPITRSAAMAEGELEARIRATLRRHADEIEPTQPPWSELVSQAGAVVLPLHGTELPPAHLKHRRGPRFGGPWLRPTMAAAVALVIAMSAAIVVQRSGDGGGAPADEGSGDNQEVAAIDAPVLVPPGSAEFDRVNAVPLPFSVELDEVGPPDITPELMAETYLYEAGFAANGESFDMDPEAAVEQIWTGGGTVQVATVWWSVRDEDGVVIADGPVFLRQEKDGRWTIVGAYTKWLTVGVNGVQRGDGRIAFTVTDNLPDATVRVTLNGKVIDHAELGGDGLKRYVQTDVTPDQVAVLEVQHMIGDAPASITSMALPPAGHDVAKIEDSLGNEATETTVTSVVRP